MGKLSEAAWSCADPGVQYDTTINDWHTCPNSGPHQRLEPVLGVHVPRRLGLQPGELNLTKFLFEKPEDGWTSTSTASATPCACSSSRRRSWSASRRTRPSASRRTRGTTARWARLREPRHDAHAHGPAVRLGRGPRRSPPRSPRSCAATPTRLGRDGRGARARSTASRRTASPCCASWASTATRRTRSPRALPRVLSRGARGLGQGRRSSERCTATATRRRRCSRPTGTIGLLMDCDTTGVEPDFSLVKFKKLAGGGYFKIVNASVPARARPASATARARSRRSSRTSRHQHASRRAAREPRQFLLEEGPDRRRPREGRGRSARRPSTLPQRVRASTCPRRGDVQAPRRERRARKSRASRCSSSRLVQEPDRGGDATTSSAG
jgi:ribonucleoside-diphosphate reductase alpha chain